MKVELNKCKEIRLEYMNMPAGNDLNTALHFACFEINLDLASTWMKHYDEEKKRKRKRFKKVDKEFSICLFGNKKISIPFNKSDKR